MMCACRMSMNKCDGKQAKVAKQKMIGRVCARAQTLGCNTLCCSCVWLDWIEPKSIMINYARPYDFSFTMLRVFAKMTSITCGTLAAGDTPSVAERKCFSFSSENHLKASCLLSVFITILSCYTAVTNVHLCLLFSVSNFIREMRKKFNLNILLIALFGFCTRRHNWVFGTD